MNEATIDKLREENARLTRENIHLRGQVDALERIVAAYRPSFVPLPAALPNVAPLPTFQWPPSILPNYVPTILAPDHGGNCACPQCVPITFAGTVNAGPLHGVAVNPACAPYPFGGQVFTGEIVTDGTLRW